MESDTVNAIQADSLRVGFGGAYKMGCAGEKCESGIQERGGGWKYALENYQFRWKLRPWEMRSLMENENGTEDGTSYIIILLSK